METKYALVLTGSTLPGFAPETVWPSLAAYFRMEPAKLTDQVLVRAPLTVKESEELGKLQTLQAGAASVGAEAEICAPDGRPALFVLLDGTPRGPVPRVFVEERVEHGLWPDRLMIAEVGSNQWRTFRELSPPPAPVPAAEAVPELEISTGRARLPGYAPTMPADHGHNLAGIAAQAQSTPAAAPVAAPAPSSGNVFSKIIAGIVGGLIVAVLGSLLVTVTLATSERASTLGSSAFFVLLVLGFAIALIAPTAGKAWRRLLLTAAVLSFLLPLSALIYTGAFMASNTNGDAAYQTGAAIGGGLLSGLMGFIGFFLGVVFLIVGLLVGRDRQVVYVERPSANPKAP